MDLLAKAKDLFTRRGGAEAAKEDAQELKDTARSDESAGDRVNESVEAIKDPGAPGEPDRPQPGQPDSPHPGEPDSPPPGGPEGEKPPV